MTDPLGDWDSQWDPPLTAVHKQYIATFDEWLRAGDEDREKHLKRRRNLLDLMRHDNPTRKGAP